jgi:hypothetical protein
VVHFSPHIEISRMAKTRTRKDRISISLSAEEKGIIQQIAKKNQISIARVVRQAITNFLQTSERQLFLFKPQSTSDESGDN